MIVPLLSYMRYVMAGFRCTIAKVTTPHGSRARGFLNDMAVSSHGDRSVHAHERVSTRKQLMYGMAQQHLKR